MNPFRSHNPSRASKLSKAILLATFAVLCLTQPLSLFAASTITYVQSAYAVPQSSQATVNVTFTSAQTAGNLNVVVVGWNDSTATVSSVRDSKGNVYTRAVGPTVVSGFLSQSVYYAKNIVAAGAAGNTVTVTFSAAAAFPDIRILEYSGADPNNPVDVTAAGSGNSTSSSSGSATTTTATDLILGADTVTTTSGLGTGFTKRILTNPDADLVEDKMVTTTGSYSATAPVMPTGRWIMQMVAFRTKAGFTIAASPTSLTVVQGNQGTSTITTTVTSGFNSAISLSASGVPSGTTVSFNPATIPAPGAGTSTMTMTVGAGTAPGTYPITVTGSGGGTQQTTTVTLTVATPPNFAISASPTSVSIAQGNQGTSTITATISGGFNSAISLSATGAPSGTTVSFNPVTIPAPGAGTSTMTITVGASTPLGSYPITVTGTGGILQRTTTVTLTVTAAANFLISASPTSVSVTQGNQGTSTITTTISGSFNSGIALSATGAPSGTTVGFNPVTIAAPGAGSSAVTITVGLTTAPGTYPITVTGNGGGIQHNTTVTLTVTAAPSFTIAASPGSVSVAPGNQGSSTITTAVSGGFNNAIALSSTGVPTGTTVSFNPTSIPAPGAGTSTMTINVGSTTAAGIYPITVTGNGGGLQQSTTVTLTVTGITPPGSLGAADGGPAPIVQAVQSYINPTFLTVHTTAPFNSTGGDLIVMFASSHAGVTMTPSDNFNNTWVTIAGPTNTATGFDLRSQIWYVANPQVGPNQTVSVTLSAPESFVMSIFVVKGSNVSSPIDAVSLMGSDNGTQSVNVVSPNITTSMMNDLLMGWVKVSAGASFISGPGFVQQPNASSNFLDAESGIAATPGLYDATFTISAAQTWQSAVVAANNHSNQSTLTWTASTENGGTIAQYLVERCQGVGCSNFAQIGTTTTTSYNDDGLTPSASYSYRVRAEDTGGNLGPYSAVVSFNTPPVIPSLPGNLTFTTPSQTEIDLAWVASTDNSGTVSQYLVERCPGSGCTNFSQIGITTGTTYDDTGLPVGSTYTYRVRAQDSSGNLSPYSNLVIGTTQSAGNFTISAFPTTVSVAQGGQGTSTITTTVSGGFNSAIALSALGAPAGTTVTFNPTAIPAPGSGTSTMTINVGSTTPVGTYPMTVTGNGGGIQQSTTVTLTVTATTSIISYVQNNYATPQSPQTTVSIPFNAAQTAGDLNVVVVGWNDTTAQVNSVTDSKGNTYSLAVGPTSISGTLSQSIYYARNIAAAAAGANSVTVTFSTAAVYPDIRIVEYIGADPNTPVDVTAANSGNSANSSSGSATTTNPTDLLFGANIVTTTTTGPGTGFTARVITNPDGDIVEDAMMTTTGSYSATAPLISGSWIMQMVAFRTTAGGGGPVLTSITVAPTNPSIGVGTPQQFTATGNYSDGSHQDLTNTATWTSSIPSVATINSSGLATAVAAGSTTIKAAVGSVNGSTTLTVTAGFGVSPRAAVVTFTQTQQFNATSGFGAVTWSVDGLVGGSPTVGTITTNGLYTPPATAGTHTITATTNQQQSANATVYVSNYAGTYTYHNDNLRTGQNNSEMVLTTSNVNHNQFGKLFSYSLDGIAFASPLYVESVNIPGQGFHNVVYVATEHDSLYAFDADGLSNLPLWHVSFLSANVTTIPCGDTGECGDIPVEIGITGTPVIDSTSGTLYVVVDTKENGSNYFQRLHALDITTGAEKFGGPVVISGSVAGTGDGSVGGRVAFNPLTECQRSGLLLNNGVVYIAFGSHGDNPPYHGWVVGYNATTLQQTMIYNVTPNGSDGGIWQGGGGLATDTTGDIFYTTSNGTFDANSGGSDYGDSVQKLSPAGSVVDYFTPHDQQNMSVNNLDLGAGGPVLLVDQPGGPHPHELISAGKSGTIYVVNRDNMGHYNPNNDSQIIQSLPGVLPNGDAEIGNFSTPVYFNGYIYYGAVNDSLKAFQLTNGLLSTAPTSESAAIFPIRGASFAISSNGSSNGILWALQNNGQAPDNDIGAPGVLFAYDANNLTNELYDTTQAGSRDTLDLAAKFSIPLVANGKVFVAGQSQLTVLGLLP